MYKKIVKLLFVAVATMQLNSSQAQSSYSDSRGPAFNPVIPTLDPGTYEKARYFYLFVATGDSEIASGTSVDLGAYTYTFTELTPNGGGSTVTTNVFSDYYFKQHFMQEACNIPTSSDILATNNTYSYTEYEPSPVSHFGPLYQNPNWLAQNFRHYMAISTGYPLADNESHSGSFSETDFGVSWNVEKSTQSLSPSGLTGEIVSGSTEWTAYDVGCIGSANFDFPIDMYGTGTLYVIDVEITGNDHGVTVSVPEPIMVSGYPLYFDEPTMSGSDFETTLHGVPNQSYLVQTNSTLDGTWGNYYSGSFDSNGEEDFAWSTDTAETYFRASSGGEQSLNGVGFYKRSGDAEDAFATANQLLLSDMQISNVINSPENFDQMQEWNGSSYNTATYSSGSWNNDFTFSSGKGMYYTGDDNTTLIFVGIIPEGDMEFTVSDSGYNFISSSLPVDGSLYYLGLPNPPASGTQVLKWNQANQNYDSYSYSFGSWSPSLPSMDVGEGFFITVPTTFTWSQSFDLWDN